MKSSLAAVELSFLVDEFSELLKDAKVDKIYQNGQVILVGLHVPNKGKKILRIEVPNLMYLTDVKGDMPTIPPGFALSLRKQLGNARLRSVEQLESERIVVFLFETKEAKWKLIVELFSKGNVILCDESDKIKTVMLPTKFKDRSLLGGQQYEYPSRKYDIKKITQKELGEVFANSDKASIVKTLALELGLGGVYAEELCLRSKVQKDLKKASEGDQALLFKDLRALMKEKKSPRVIENGKDIVPLKLQYYEKDEQKEYESYSEALDAVLTDHSQKQVQAVTTSKVEKELTKLKKLVKIQEAQIKKQEKIVEEDTRKAELIYERYQEVYDLLNEINSLRKEMTWADVKKKLKHNKLLKEINEKNGEIVIEL